MIETISPTRAASSFFKETFSKLTVIKFTIFTFLIAAYDSISTYWILHIVVYVPFALDKGTSYYTFGELTKFSLWVFTHYPEGELLMFFIEWGLAFGLSLALWGFSSYIVLLGKRLLRKDSWRLKVDSP